MRAWDLLARKICYKNLEEFKVPYVYYDVNSLHFDVIKTRASGYMPLDSQSSFDPKVVTITIPSDNFPRVTEIPDKVDKIICGMIREYPDDMRKLLFVSSMYNTVDGMQLERKTKPFFVKHGPIPERFSKLDSEDI